MQSGQSGRFDFKQQTLYAIQTLVSRSLQFRDGHLPKLNGCRHPLPKKIGKKERNQAVHLLTFAVR
jgi:hypothetical protein